MSTLAPLDRADLLRWTQTAFGASGAEVVRDEFKACLRATAELLHVEEEQAALADGLQLACDQLRAERDELEGKLASVRASLADVVARI